MNTIQREEANQYLENEVARCKQRRKPRIIRIRRITGKLRRQNKKAIRKHNKMNKHNEEIN